MRSCAIPVWRGGGWRPCGASPALPVGNAKGTTAACPACAFLLTLPCKGTLQ